MKYFTFASFDQLGLKHAVFTRKGGVSPAPWNSLNTGGLSGDERTNIIENRRRIFSAMNLPVESIYDVWQVHSNVVVLADRPRSLDTPHQKADAIITNQRGLTLLMRFGDCVPLLFFDPVKSVIGIAHAGWQGTVKHIGEITVNTMKAQFGCNPSHILVGIGPSIGPDHYQVGPDVIGIFIQAFQNRDEIIEQRSGRTYLNLWKANAATLRNSGVERIEIAEICTACHTDDWYSHRAEHGKTGRFAALIHLGQ